MEFYLTILSTLVLLSAFMLMANKRTNAYINTFRVQSLLIAITAGLIGFHNLITDGEFNVLVICVIIVVVKVIFIPNLLHKTYANVEYVVEKGFFLNIPSLVLVCAGLVIFTYFLFGALDGLNAGPINIQLVNSVSVVFIGLFFMISRKKAIGQIVGFLVIENGLFVTAMFSTQGMPFIVDLGIFIDLITAVMVMGIMVFRINEAFESIDINKLKNLRG